MAKAVHAVHCTVYLDGLANPSHGRLGQEWQRHEKNGCGQWPKVCSEPTVGQQNRRHHLCIPECVPLGLGLARATRGSIGVIAVAEGRQGGQIVPLNRCSASGQVREWWPHSTQRARIERAPVAWQTLGHRAEVKAETRKQCHHVATNTCHHWLLSAARHNTSDCWRRARQNEDNRGAGNGQQESRTVGECMA